MAGKNTHPQGGGNEFVGFHHLGILVYDVEKTDKLAGEMRHLSDGENVDNTVGYYEFKCRNPD